LNDSEFGGGHVRAMAGAVQIIAFPSLRLADASARLLRTYARNDMSERISDAEPFRELDLI